VDNEEVSWFAHGVPHEELRLQFDWAATDLRRVELLWEEYSRIYGGRAGETEPTTTTTTEDSEDDGTGKEEDRAVLLLNGVDPHCFYFIQQAFVEALVLGTGRLLDSPSMRKRENISFRSLIKKALEVEKDTLKRSKLDEQRGRLARLKNRTAEPLQRWRNKVVGHTDAQTRRSGSLKSLDLKIVESFLHEAREWLQITREVVTGERGRWPPDAEPKRYGNLTETLEKYFEMAAALTIPELRTDSLLNYAAQRTPAAIQLKHRSGRDNAREE